MTLRGWAKRLALLAAALLLLLVLGFFIFVPGSEEAEPAASLALQSDAAVEVSSDGWQVFQPKSSAKVRHGLIFYPGGFADPVAYAPLLRELARAGYLVVNTPAPLGLAILAPDQALEVMDAFPQVGSWSIAGHSMGGVMAAAFAGNYSDRVSGLLLWASYPMDSAALSDSKLPATSIYGSADSFASVAEIEAGKKSLPPGTRYVLIEGADHYQFGNFASAPVNASISRHDQQRQIISASLDALREHRQVQQSQ
jgi:pimeloyl-ACP methyl ester carboxylesterase